jgi:hypothetical protein
MFICFMLTATTLRLIYCIRVFIDFRKKIKDQRNLIEIIIHQPQTVDVIFKEAEADSLKKLD